MRRVMKSVAIVLLLFISLGVLVNCYGSYTLWHKVYHWNGTLGNKWVKTIVHLLLWIIPVYEICGIIDFFILNTIEFWVGSNPLAMAPGEKETQVVKLEGESYQITATMNRFDVVQLTGEKAGQTAALVYDPDTSSWYAESAMLNVKLAEMDGKNPNIMYLFRPGNKVQEVHIH